MRGYHLGRLIGYVAMLGMCALLAGCATPAGQSAQATATLQLAQVCQQIATAYNTAAGYEAEGKLSTSATFAMLTFEPQAKALCNPASPPADTTTALAEAQEILSNLGVAMAGVK